jgi:hypothetical protein
MLLISRNSEHVQVWVDVAFAEQVDVKPAGLAREHLPRHGGTNRVRSGSSLRRLSWIRLQQDFWASFARTLI